MAVLAVDIGGTSVKTAIFTSPVQALHLSVLPTHQFGASFTVAALADHLRAAQTAAVIDDPITSVGVAIAAVVDPRTGHVKVGENVGWRDVPLKRRLEEHLQLPVHVDVDAFCGALAEARLGAGQDLDHFLYVVIGTGIGHGLVLNRRVWHGMHAAANVFGHLKVKLAGEPCYCGGSGCVCQYASGQGLAQLGKTAVGSQLDEITGLQVVEAYCTGEQWARDVITQALKQLAFALSSYYNLLDIECTVFGGGAVSGSFPDFEHFRALLEPLVYPEIRPIVLRRAALGDKAVLTGAALLAFESLRNGADS